MITVHKNLSSICTSQIVNLEVNQAALAVWINPIKKMNNLA